MVQWISCLQDQHEFESPEDTVLWVWWDIPVIIVFFQSGRQDDLGSYPGQQEAATGSR